MQKRCLELLGGLKQALTMMTRFTNGHKAQKTRAATKAKLDADKDELSRQRKETKERAEYLRRQVAGSVCPLALVPLAEMLKVPSFADEIPTGHPLDLPCLITGAEAIQIWLDDPVVQTVMGSYAAKYKKEPDFNTQLKTTQPFKAKQGMEQTEKMFGTVLASVSSQVVDLSTIAATWNTTSWMFGCMPSKEVVAATPNSCGMLRLIMWGDIDSFMVKSSFVDTLSGNSTTGMTDTCKQMKNLSDADVKALKAKNVPIYQISQTKGTVLYMPMGWILLDRHGVSPLIYGCRKSLMIKGSMTSESTMNYTFNKQLLARDKKSVDRMEAITKLIIL
jgi:hypothetical protein